MDVCQSSYQLFSKERMSGDPDVGDFGAFFIHWWLPLLPIKVLSVIMVFYLLLLKII